MIIMISGIIITLIALFNLKYKKILAFHKG
jgi:hypothetical protein